MTLDTQWLSKCEDIFALETMEYCTYEVNLLSLIFWFENGHFKKSHNNRGSQGGDLHDFLF